MSDEATDADVARLTTALEAAEDLADRLRADHRAELAEAEKQIREADAETKRLSEQNTLLIAMLERIPGVHMRFHVIDGELAEVCADWCYACKLEQAEAERDQLKAANDRVRALRSRSSQGYIRDFIPAAEVRAALDQPEEMP